MARRRLRPVIALFVTVASVGLAAESAAANHRGAVADCGIAGTFTVRATPNGAGFESPPFGDVLLFAEGGTLSVLRLSVDGQVTWEAAAVGRARNNVEEVTCSFTLANGVEVQATGVFTGR
jgi:hypothetical protein